jgi:hypothetical protein
MNLFLTSEIPLSCRCQYARLGVSFYFIEPAPDRQEIEEVC